MTIRKLFSRAAAVVLAVCLVGGATGFEPGEFAVGANDEIKKSGYLYYRDMGDFIEITGYDHALFDYFDYMEEKGIKTDRYYLIPDSIDGKYVTSIGSKAFISCTEEDHKNHSEANIAIDLPDHLEHIASDAFEPMIMNGERGSHSFFPWLPWMFWYYPGETREYPVLKCYLDYLNEYQIDPSLPDGKYVLHTDKGDIKQEDMDEPFVLQQAGSDSSIKVTYDPTTGIIKVPSNFNTSKDIVSLYRASIRFPAGFKGGLTIGAGEIILDEEANIVNSLWSYTLTADEFTPYTALPTLRNILKGIPSTSYNPKLAYMLCILAQSAYNEKEIITNYQNRGFTNYSIYDYDTTYTQADNCGYVIGYRDLEDGTREFLITVRGTANPIYNPFGKEWWSDFNLGFGQINPWAPCPDYHDGFEAAADRIYESLQKYNDGTIRTKKVRYVLTGHSRGAAVSNIVSKWLIDSGVSKNDLYSYNFACPGTAIDKESEFTSSKYISIFNLNCARDLVGQAPGEKLTLLSIPFLGTMGSKDPAQWGKYGQTYFWDANWDSSKSASVTELGTYHPCDTNYIPYFSQQNELSEFKTFYDMKNIQDSNWYKPRTVTLVKQINIFPPFESKVGATISDATGNIVATLKNGMLEIVSGMEDKMIGNIGDDGVIQIAMDSSEEYQVSVTSDAPVTIAVAQGNQNYNSVNNGAVYTAEPGNTTIDITPDTPAAETPVIDDSGKTIEPDKVWNLGDTNSDGDVNIADAVVLQRWLLNKPDSDIAEWTAADIYEDGKLNVYDLTLLKQLITE